MITKSIVSERALTENEYAGLSMDFIGSVILACLVLLVGILALVALFVLVITVFAGLGMVYEKLQKMDRFKRIRQDKW